MNRPTIPTRSLMILFPAALLVVTALACAQTDAPVVYVTATVASPVPSGEPTLRNPFRPTPSPIGPTATAIQPTPNPTPPPASTVIEHTVALGDTLSALAATYGTDVNRILALNPALSLDSLLSPGQVLTMPGRPSATTPNFKLIPDSELVNSPAARDFDVETYIKYQPGFIRVYSENVLGQRWMSGTEIIMFHANTASVNPRLLLALLEYRGGWVTNPVPDADAMRYPMGRRDERLTGLFNQVAFAVNQLNNGYYGWRTRGLTTLQFDDGARLAFAPELNGGTIGVQYFLARTTGDRARWAYDVSVAGFFTTYMSMFGDPFRYAIEPLVSPDLRQPELALPFAQGEVWYLTSGPHGGWDARASGWGAVDFAPPSPPDEILIAQGNCYVSPIFARAMAAGMVVRSGDGAVVIDLDMDGDERTGWVLTYLHIADADRVPAGTIVQPGTPIGRPSCEGFYLNSGGTHVHIARKYNGEWIVADCTACLPGVAAPPFVMSGWELKGYPGQVWQGWLQRGGEVRRANQGRDDPTNQVSW
jgi:murein DD-endopeptidase MepM/ murein hydrolase activator NlpD